MGLLNRNAVGLVALALGASACGASMRQYAGYAGTDDDAKAWSALQPGERVALYDGAKRCKAVVADSVGALDQGQALGDVDWGRAVTVWTVRSARVTDEGVDENGEAPSAGTVQGALVLTLEDASGKRQALRYAMGQRPGCMWRATQAFDDARALVGKRLSYDPAASTCVTIEAAGTSPDAALVDGDPTAGFTMEALEIGPPSAQRFASWDGSGPTAVWLRANGGALHIRVDTVRTCFTDAAQPKASDPAVLTLARTPVERCEVEHSLVTCRSSLGVWEGVASNSAVSLRAVRRTLGALHLLDGKPVSSGRFARTVVAIDMAKARDSREGALYVAMQGAAQQVLSGGDGGVRAVMPGDPDTTLPISVAVHDLVISDLVTRTSSEQSQYEDHKETRPNPDKAKAQAAIGEAQQGVDSAVQSYNQRKQAEAQAHDACINACNNVTDANWRNTCLTGCNVASTVADIVDNDSDVQAARNKLTQAQTNYASTPDTIEVPIMMPWNYSKTTYQRGVSATLEVEAKFAAGPQHWSTPLSSSVDDYEVAGDARHNVTAHAAARDFIDRPDSLIPRIAQLVATQLAKQVRSGINRERQERAVAAFEQAGHEATRPENAAVDAAAFDLVGARMQKSVQHGGADVAAGDPGFTIQVGSVGPSCVLVVAVSDDPDVGLTLQTEGGSHADRRGRSTAEIEICPGEPGNPSPVVHLTAAKPVHARWGVFATAPGH
ncbi:MAG TPA: hypothetical protein VF765_27420 [Polyangiaceae bacterium]